MQGIFPEDSVSLPSISTVLEVFLCIYRFVGGSPTLDSPGLYAPVSSCALGAEPPGCYGVRTALTRGLINMYEGVYMGLYSTLYYSLATQK